LAIKVEKAVCSVLDPKRSQEIMALIAATDDSLNQKSLLNQKISVDEEASDHVFWPSELGCASESESDSMYD
jgi:hypothetical protein